VLQLRAENSFLKDKQALNSETQISQQREELQMRTVNGELTRQLNQTL